MDFHKAAYLSLFLKEQATPPQTTSSAAVPCQEIGKVTAPVQSCLYKDYQRYNRCYSGKVRTGISAIRKTNQCLDPALEKLKVYNTVLIPSPPHTHESRNSMTQAQGN